MPLISGPLRRGAPHVPSPDAARSSVPADRRRHLAVLAVVIAVSVFGYFLLPSRTVSVLADGEELSVRTYSSNDAAVLRGVGVDLRPGDRVTALDGNGTDVLRIDRARDVVLEVDGTTYRVRTHALTIDQVLAEADVAITGRDSVVQDGVIVSLNAPVEAPKLFASRTPLERAREAEMTRIEVRRAVELTIVDDGAELTSTSSLPTVAQVLREAGVVLGPGDVVRPGPDDMLAPGERIEIRHARAMTVALPDGHRTLYTLATTVGEALDEAGIVLPTGGFVVPEVTAPVTAGMSVRVIQLSASSDVEYEYIASSTVYESDPSLPPGQIRTEPGHDGVRIRRYEVSYVDGVEAGRELIEDVFDPEPLDTIVYYPTQTGANESQPAPEEGGARVVRVYATYYTPASAGRDASDPAYGRTANGSLVTYGIVAVDPTVIPLGTRMFIPGYGYAVAADTGGAVRGYIIDLGYPDGVDIDWTPQWLDIYILE